MIRQSQLNVLNENHPPYSYLINKIRCGKNFGEYIEIYFLTLIPKKIFDHNKTELVFGLTEFCIG